MRKIYEFILHDIWMIPSQKLPVIHRIFLFLVRIIILTGRLFLQNKCTVKASSLTFFTLFSFVPVAALIFGIAQGCGIARLLEERIRCWLSMYPETAEKIITFTTATLNQAKGGVIAGAGILILIWTTVKLLSNIEGTLNDIWGLPKGRGFIRKITDYIAIIIICPFLLATAGSGLVVATTHIGTIVRALPFAESIAPVLGILTKGVPVVSVWIVLCFIYLAIPNTKVRIYAALPAGLFSAILYILLQVCYIYAQFVIVKYNTIYGSFAAIPLLLLWLNTSWIIILAGAQLSFVIQNVSEYEMQPMEGKISTRQRNIFAMEFVWKVCDSFRKGETALTEDEISAFYEVPIRTTRMILHQLVQAGVLSEIIPDGDLRQRAYLPAKAVELLSPVGVIAVLEKTDGFTAVSGEDPVFAGKYNQILDSAAGSPHNVFMKGIFPQRNKQGHSRSFPS